MVETNTRFLPNSLDLLTKKDVRFKELSGGVLSQTPCPRFNSGAFVFPGSKSPLGHALFLSKGIIHQQMFLVAYSKLLVFKEYEYERLLFKALEFNSMDPLGTWKIERKNGLIFPLLELTLFPPPAEDINQDLIWRACVSIDMLFKAKAEEFKGDVQPQDVEVQKQVKTFLEYMGFKKIKEQPISGGISYLIVLSNDEDNEESVWKRFPLKIEATDLIVYRVYFSIKDAAVTSRKGFSNSSKVLIAYINSHLPMGHFNYVSATNQLQLVFKMQYKTMSSPDIWQSLRVYYDTIIQFYKWTSPGLVQLYLDVIDRTRSTSEMGNYLEKVSNEIQGETLEKVLDDTNQENLLWSDLSLLKRLEDPTLHKFLLPNLSVRIGTKVRVTTQRNLVPLVDHFERFAYTRDALIKETLSLFDALVKLSVFPTLEMLFCSPPPLFNLYIIPTKGLHEDPERFLDEVMNFTLEGFADLKASLSRTLKSDYLKQDLSAFEPPETTSLDEYFFRKTKLGGNKYIFYNRNQGKFTRMDMLLLEQYLSQLAQLPTYPNTITGWTRVPSDELRNIMSPNSRNSASTASSDSEIWNYYLVEQYNFAFVKSDFEQAFIEIAKLALDLHKMRFFHWFICPFTIRRRPMSQEMTLVLPCLKPSYFEFIISFLPKKSRHFLAPEVREYEESGRIVKDGKKADVYSLCKVIEWYYAEGATKSKRVMPIDLKGVVASGLMENPDERPTMEQLFASLSDILAQPYQKLKQDFSRNHWTINGNVATVNISKTDLFQAKFTYVGKVWFAETVFQVPPALRKTDTLKRKSVRLLARNGLTYDLCVEYINQLQGIWTEIGNKVENVDCENEAAFERLDDVLLDCEMLREYIPLKSHQSADFTQTTEGSDIKVTSTQVLKHITEGLADPQLRQHLFHQLLSLIDKLDFQHLALDSFYYKPLSLQLVVVPHPDQTMDFYQFISSDCWDALLKETSSYITHEELQTYRLILKDKQFWTAGPLTKHVYFQRVHHFWWLQDTTPISSAFLFLMTMYKFCVISKKLLPWSSPTTETKLASSTVASYGTNGDDEIPIGQPQDNAGSDMETTQLSRRLHSAQQESRSFLLNAVNSVLSLHRKGLFHGLICPSTILKGFKNKCYFLTPALIWQGLLALYEVVPDEEREAYIAPEVRLVAEEWQKPSEDVDFMNADTYGLSRYIRVKFENLCNENSQLNELIEQGLSPDRRDRPSLEAFKEALQR